ncbi:LysR family transcriptional regulator [Pseudoalteromonas luteoviolacea]|nr:LysR family transcriptional regulator [Pseudoalteromonas luteoviolacea]
MTLSKTKVFEYNKKGHIFKRIAKKNAESVLMLDVSDIHILSTISETGSINKAAEKLFMSQPTLSKRISRLEQVLKVELFHRNSTGMKPTDVTNYLISNGKQIQSKLDAMCRHVELLSNLEGGTLNIGVSPIIEQLFFPKVLMDFVEDSNNVEISFQVALPDKLQQGILDGDLDIAIGPFVRGELPQEWVITEVKNESLIFVVRAGHPILKSRGPVSIADLNKYPVIGPAMNKPIADFLTSHGMSLPLNITCDNYHISKSIVMMSEHYTGGPRELFSNELSNGDLVEVKIEAEIPWRAYCITRPETIYAPTVKKFIDILNQYTV